MFCAVPVYVVLWQGQIHALVVLAVALVLAGLMGLEREPERAERHLRWIQLGLLISLLSKPLVALMLPVLFVLPETRRKLLLPVAVYAVVSLLFLWVPRLNPGGYNGMHWLYIPVAVFKGRLSLGVLRPCACDLSQNCWVLSLPMLLNAAGAHEMVLLAAKLPTVAVGLMSLAPLFLPERGQRIRAAMVVASLSVLSYNLTYFQGWEYHYAALLPLLPAMLWLRRQETVPWLRGLLTGSFLVSLPLLLPTPIFLGQGDPRFWAAATVQRVTPPIAAFLGLLAYGAASAWLARRRPRLISLQMARGVSLRFASAACSASCSPPWPQAHA